VLQGAGNRTKILASSSNTSIGSTSSNRYFRHAPGSNSANPLPYFGMSRGAACFTDSGKRGHMRSAALWAFGGYYPLSISIFMGFREDPRLPTNHSSFTIQFDMDSTTFDMKVNQRTLSNRPDGDQRRRLSLRLLWSGGPFLHDVKLVLRCQMHILVIIRELHDTTRPTTRQP
jgi:hypothetical protein